MFPARSRRVTNNKGEAKMLLSNGESNDVSLERVGQSGIHRLSPFCYWLRRATARETFFTYRTNLNVLDLMLISIL